MYFKRTAQNVLFYTVSAHFGLLMRLPLSLLCIRSVFPIFHLGSFSLCLTYNLQNFLCSNELSPVLYA